MGPELKGKNLTVQMVQGSMMDDREHTKQLIGAVNVATTMFGTLAHIPEREIRREKLSVFSEITDGQFVMTVPNTVSWQENLEKYDQLRAEGEPYKLAKEVGDIYYGREGSDIEIFFHLFTQEELREDLAAANLPIIELGAAKIRTEAEITAEGNEGLLLRDANESEELDLDDGELADKARYFLVMAEGQRERGQEIAGLSGDVGRGR